MKPRLRRTLIYSATGAAVAFSMVTAGDETSRVDLKSPFVRTEAIVVYRTKTPGSRSDCDNPPAAIRDLQTVSKYGANRQEHDSSVIDPDAAAEYAEDTQPVADFANQVAKRADRFASKGGSAVSDASCALLWMDSWAGDDGLLGEMNGTGQSFRKWQLATLATAYLKIRKAPIDPDQASRVRNWLQLIADEVRKDYSGKLVLDSRSNNHLNWAAWAVMAAAIAANDDELFDWSIDRFHYAVAQIGDDGTLPLELKRRQLALAYHNYALAPLIMLREGARYNGIYLAPQEERRLRRLIDLVLTDLDDASFIERRTGYRQDLRQISQAHLAWLEPYYARSGDRRALKWLTRYRPMTFARLGGNLTTLYARSHSGPTARRANASSP